MKVNYLLNVYPAKSETFVYNELKIAHEQGCLEHIYVRVVDHKLIEEDFFYKRGLISKFNTSYIGRAEKLRLCAAGLAKFGLNFAKTLSLAKKNNETEFFWQAVRFVVKGPIDKQHFFHAHFLGNGAKNLHYVHRLVGSNYSVTAHGSDIYINPPESISQIIEQSAVTTTISGFNKRHLVEKLNAPEDKVMVNYEGVIPEQFSYKAYSRNSGPFRIINTGRLHPVKGQKYLIEATSILISKGLEVELVIVGGGELKQDLNKLAIDKGIGNAVSLQGFLPAEQVAGFLEGADLFVLSSVSEGLSVALMEAMAIGLPVVSTDVNGVSELIADGESGRIVEAENADALANAVEELIRNPEMLKEFSLNAHQTIVKKFNKKQNVQRLIEQWKAHQPSK